MSCEGWLTYVDTTLGYCELDTKSIIYLSLLKLNNNDFTLPTLPSRISVKKAQSPIQGFYICTNESVIEAKFETNFESKSFIKLLRNNIDYATEVLHLACKATKILKEDFNIKDKILEQTLILQTLEKLLPIQKSPNAKLLKSVHECKSVKLLTADYNNFPSWSFGVQSEFKNVIFGFLYVCTVKGCLLLRNSHYKFRLILPNSCFKDINALDQSYVLLRNYKTFSEIFSDAKVPNIEYMYVNFGDIVLVSRNQDACFLGQTNIISSNQTFKNVFKFTLKRKSSVSKSNIQKVSFDLTVWIGSSLRPEYYLEALVTDGNKDINIETIFLTLPEDYVVMINHLKEDNNYALHYNQLRLVKNQELQYIANHKNFLLLDKNSRFQKIVSSTEEAFKKNVLTVQQCKSALSNRTDLINVQGVISKKNFVKTLSSRTQKKPTKLSGFGTTGEKTHQLVFKFENSDGSSGFLDCYLANMENALNPAGLVPQMRVLVKNALPQSKKYLKSSVFTSFEIISYEPMVDFDTPVLNGGFEELTWGKPFSLGLGKHLPHNVLVWGKVTNFYTTKITMKNACKGCKIINESAGPCSQCSCSERDMNFFLIMHAADQHGEVRIIAKDPRILKDVLNIPPNQFHTWLQDFSQLGSFTFNIYEPVQYSFYNDQERFKCLLTDLLLAVNKTAIRELEIKCRYLDSNPSKSGGRSLFFYIDSRRNAL